MILEDWFFGDIVYGVIWYILWSDDCIGVFNDFDVIDDYGIEICEGEIVEVIDCCIIVLEIVYCGVVLCIGDCGFINVGDVFGGIDYVCCIDVFDEIMCDY